MLGESNSSHPSAAEAIAAPLETIPFEREELERSIVARFERVAALLPDHVALDGNGERWTYEQLDRRANQIARGILALAPEPAGCAAMLLDHSPAMVAVVLGALKAVKAYLCIHPRQPPAAQREIIADAAPDLIVTDAAHANASRELMADDGKVLLLEDIASESPSGRPGRAVSSDDPAAIIYTSGTTGKPKGIFKTHRSVLHRAWLCAQYDGVNSTDRQSLLTYCSFASSEADVFGALLNGAAVHLFDPALNGLDELGAWIDQHRITLLHPPVVLFRRYLSTLDDSNLHPSVRLVCLAGETVIASDLERWRQYFPRSCGLRHRFSSTEAGHMAVGRIEPGQDIPAGEVPAALPVTDKELIVIGDQGQPLPQGEVGELVVRSEFLAGGYWRRPGETAEAFSPDPARPGVSVFRTGDMGRLLADGRFEFQGRRDHQVKIRGFRIEIREVENALQRLPGVKEAAIIADAIDDENRLIAFVVSDPTTPADAESLRTGMRALLPEWKVPAFFQFIQALPLTLTGKINRQALQQRARSAAAVVNARASTAVSNGSAADDPIIAQLTTIWAGLLGGAAIGPDENFFDRGGHSLTAAQMLHRTRMKFGRTMTLSMLVERPTIRQMADWLNLPASSEPPTDASQTFVTLKATGAGLPLYFLPRPDPTPYGYLPLARLLRCDRPIYAVLDPNDHPGAPFDTSVEQLGARLVSLLCQRQPNGDFHLCGHSHSGVLAYEVARQLHAMGRRVELLALLDSRVPGARRFIPEDLTALERWRRRIAKTRLAAMVRGVKCAFLHEHISPAAQAVVEPPGLDPALTPRRAAVKEMFRRYCPKPYDGAITLFRAMTPPNNPRFELPGPMNGWDAFCDQIEVLPIPCDHNEMMRDPHLAVLAASMSERMQRAVTCG